MLNMQIIKKKKSVKIQEYLFYCWKRAQSRFMWLLKFITTINVQF